MKRNSRCYTKFTEARTVTWRYKIYRVVSISYWYLVSHVLSRLQQHSVVRTPILTMKPNVTLLNLLTLTDPRTLNPNHINPNLSDVITHFRTSDLSHQ